jgi:TetR/AcrR family transcriptional repressor of nem operon
VNQTGLSSVYNGVNRPVGQDEAIDVHKESNTRQTILDAALELMTRRGFSNTSVADIVKASGVDKGTLYHFFRSKEQLGEAVLDHYWTLQSGPVASSLKGLSDSPLERVRRFMSGETLGAGEGQFSGCFLGNTIAEMSILDKRLSDKACELLGEFQRLVEAELEAAVEVGELAPGTRTELVGRQLVAYLEGCILLAKGCQDVRKIQELCGGVDAILGAHSTNSGERYNRGGVMTPGKA